MMKAYIDLSQQQDIATALPAQIHQGTAMHPQETQELDTFLDQLVQVRGITKDPEADNLISRAVAQQPDAAYLLVQRAMLVERALEAAKAQIASLQSQAPSGQAQGQGFLNAEPWGNAPANAAPPTPANGQAPGTQAQAPAASPGFFSGGMKGALGSVATTAAGVAGGAFLFQGIENMMHPGGGTGFLNPATGAATPAAETTTTNNFFENEPDKPTSSTSDSDLMASDDAGLGDDSFI